jgi:predicted Zn-dependent protease
MRLSAIIVYGNAISVLAGLPLFAQNQATVEKQAALGRQMATDFRQHTTAIASRRVQDYVENLGRELASQMPANPFSFTFCVIAEDPCPTMHEPYALPDGYVFVSAALFSAAQDGAEFAGMMAHAMAHVVERHATRQAPRGELIGSPGIAGVFVGCASAVAVPVGFLKVQRSSELQADRLAVQTMAQAGFDPNALARYTERVQPPVPTTLAAFSPLPPRDERIASILSEIAKLPSPDYATLTTGAFEAAREEVVRRLLPSNRSTPPSLRRKPA